MSEIVRRIEQTDILHYVEQTRRNRKAEEQDILAGQVMIRRFREQLAGIIRRYTDPEVCKRDIIIGTNYRGADRIAIFENLGSVILDCFVPSEEGTVQVTLSASAYPSDRLKPGRIHELDYSIEVEDYPYSMLIRPAGGVMARRLSINPNERGETGQVCANQYHLRNYNAIFRDIKRPGVKFLTRSREVVKYC